jgi:MerR HTH family regulatory protein
VDNPPEAKGVLVALLSIGEFARLSWLSTKALRLYDQLGLMTPARVDPGSAYRFYEVATCEIAERALLFLERTVTDQQEVWAAGKELISLFKGQPLLQIPGRTGAFFVILNYYGEVNAERDGPVEFCRPILESQGEELAARFPGLAFGVEPAHKEAFVSLGNAEVSAAQWLLVASTLIAWVGEQHQLPSELGVRLTHLAEPPRTDGGPDIDFAVALHNRSDREAA